MYVCMYVCLRYVCAPGTCGTCEGQEGAPELLEPELTDSCGCWESVFGSLEDQPLLLTAKSLFL